MSIIREIKSADPALRLGFAAQNIERIEAEIDVCKERVHFASVRLDQATMNLARYGPTSRRHREEWRRGRDNFEEEEAILTSFLAHRERARRELLEISNEVLAADMKKQGGA